MVGFSVNIFKILISISIFNSERELWPRMRLNGRLNSRTNNWVRTIEVDRGLKRFWNDGYQARDLNKLMVAMPQWDLRQKIQRLEWGSRAFSRRLLTIHPWLASRWWMAAFTGDYWRAPSRTFQFLKTSGGPKIKLLTESFWVRSFGLWPRHTSSRPFHQKARHWRSEWGLPPSSIVLMDIR